MVRIALILRSISCLFVGHDYWLRIKTIIPYFPEDKIRYKTEKYCIRCFKTEE